MFWNSEFLGAGQPVQGRRGRVVSAFDLTIFKVFLVQAHHGLEEVMVQPKLVIELVEQVGLGNRVETIVTSIGAHMGEVVFFDKAIVIFGIRASAAEFQGMGTFLPEPHQMIVEKF